MKTFKTSKGTELPLLDLRGKDYLQVAHRLVWFREEHHDWSIETSFVVLEKDSTIAKAVIKDASGKVMATAHKSENTKGFADHMEKAETGAVGRALAMCGYGTQFAPELEEGDRLADAPLTSKAGAVNTVVFSNKTQPKPTSSEIGPIMDRGQEVKAADYVISWGKYKGQRVGDIDQIDLDSYCKWVVSKAKEQGKEVTGKAAELLIVVEEYLQDWYSEQSFKKM